MASSSAPRRVLRVSAAALLVLLLPVCSAFDEGDDGSSSSSGGPDNVDASADAGGNDDGAVHADDAGTDADAGDGGSFHCGRFAAPPILCDDFDNPPPSGQWTPWDDVFTLPPGIATPLYDTGSLRVDTGRMGPDRSSYLTKSISTASGWSRIDMTMKLHLSELLPANGSNTVTVTTLLVRLAHSGPEKRQLHYRFVRDSTDGGGGVVTGHLQGLDLTDVAFTITQPMDTWFEMTTTIHNNGTTVWAEVTQGGKLALQRYDMEVTPPVTMMMINLGSQIADDGAGADVRYDDVGIERN